jgi:hypothetical protein
LLLGKKTGAVIYKLYINIYLYLVVKSRENWEAEWVGSEMGIGADSPRGAEAWIVVPVVALAAACVRRGLWKGTTLVMPLGTVDDEL